MANRQGVWLDVRLELKFADNFKLSENEAGSLVELES